MFEGVRNTSLVLKNVRTPCLTGREERLVLSPDRTKYQSKYLNRVKILQNTLKL